MRRLALPLISIAACGACSALIGADFNDKTLAGTGDTTASGGTGATSPTSGGGGNAGGTTGGSAGSAGNPTGGTGGSTGSTGGMTGGTGGSGGMTGTGGGDVCALGGPGTVKWVAPIGVKGGTFPFPGHVLGLPNGHSLFFGTATGTTLSAGPKLINLDSLEMVLVDVGPDGAVVDARALGGPGQQTALGLTQAPSDPQKLFFWGNEAGAFKLGSFVPASGQPSVLLFSLDVPQLFVPDPWSGNPVPPVTWGDTPATLGGVAVDGPGHVFTSLTFTGTLTGWFSEFIGSGSGDVQAFVTSGAETLAGGNMWKTDGGCDLPGMTSWIPGPIAVEPNGKLLVTGLLSGDRCSFKSDNGQGLALMEYSSDLNPFFSTIAHGAVAIGGVAAGDSKSWIVSSNGPTLDIDGFTSPGGVDASFSADGAISILATSVAVAPGEDNPIVTAEFPGKLTTGGAVLGDQPNSAAVFKLSGSSGSVLWSRVLGSQLPDIHLDSVTVDSAKQVIVAGRFLATPSFGGVPVSLPPGDTYAFVAALCP